jgi:NDP-sugar pyrophosphorylase family protein
MVVYDNRQDTGVKNNVALDEASMVVRYHKDSSDPSLKYVEAGALILHNEVINLIPEGASISLEEGLYPTLIQQRELAAYVARQRFYDIGTTEQQRAFAEFLKRRAA